MTDYTEYSVAQLLEMCKAQETTLRDILGYDTVEVRSFTVYETSIIVNFVAEDDFQADLAPDDRVDSGYYHAATIGKFLAMSPATWRSRGQRELAVMARKLASIGADTDKIKSEQARAFATAMQEHYAKIAGLLENKSGMTD